MFGNQIIGESLEIVLGYFSRLAGDRGLLRIKENLPKVSARVTVQLPEAKQYPRRPKIGQATLNRLTMLIVGLAEITR